MFVLCVAERDKEDNAGRVLREFGFRMTGEIAALGKAISRVCTNKRRIIGVGRRVSEGCQSKLAPRRNYCRQKLAGSRTADQGRLPIDLNKRFYKRKHSLKRLANERHVRRTGRSHVGQHSGQQTHYPTV